MTIKITSYKLALLRAINDLILAYPELTTGAGDVTTALRRIAELWIVRHRPLDDEEYLLYWGTRAQRDGVLRNDLSFRPALEQLRVQWQLTVQLGVLPSDGFLLVADMLTPRRRATSLSSIRNR